VDQSRFQEAQRAYDAGDYRSAAKAFLAAAGRGPDGNGAAYHMAGNSLMRLRRHPDAVTVYGHALRDQTYDRRGAVFANLGAAYVALGEYADAVHAYENALGEPDYATPYKAYQGMAGALLERGRVEDAAVAYRKAALDPGNPDPGKALVNLGLCFMALGRPHDAVDAYQAALGFAEYEGRGKALANLGQAYTALGEYGDAVKAFEKATELHNHKLSPAALDAYQTAVNQVKPPAEIVEGWETGQMPPVALPADGSSAQWPTEQFAAAATQPEVAAPGAASEEELSALWGGASTESGPTSAPLAPESPAPAPAVTPEPAAEAATLGTAEQRETAAVPETPPAWFDAATDAAVATGAAEAEQERAALAPETESASDSSSVAVYDYEAEGDLTARALGFGDEEDVADFFTVTEEELKERDRAARKSQVGAGGTKTGLKVAVAAFVMVLAIVGLAVAGYFVGLGLPTQAQTVSGLLTAYGQGGAVDTYWVAVPSQDVTKEMAKIPPLKTFQIDGVVRGPATSTVSVTVTPKKGAPLHYTVTLGREGVGWKVSGVDNEWRSTGGGS
jgi:tetratricopeptide (TPR) repeat protein